MTATTNSPASPVRRDSLLSRITGRWESIVLLWLLISVPVVMLIYLYIEPTFEAFGTLQVEPVTARLFQEAGPESIDDRGVTLYLQTQVGLLTSDRVLQEAVTDPRVVNLSVIKESEDPKADLRKELVVEIVPDAYLIRVALELPDPNQAATIVNAVVRSYLTYNSEYQRGRNSTLRANLIAEQERIQKEIKEKRAELEKMVNAGSVNVAGPPLILNESGKAADPTQPVFSNLTNELLQQIASEMVKTDLELIKAQAMLETKQAAIEGQNDLHSRQALDEQKQSVAALLKQKEDLAKYFARSKVEKKIASNDTFELVFLSRQLETLQKDAEHLNNNIKELQFKASQEDFRVSQVDQAVAQKIPTHNDRLKYVAAAPIVVLLMLVGLFLFMPIRDESLSQSSAKPSPPGEIAS